MKLISKYNTMHEEEDQGRLLLDKQIQENYYDELHK